MMLNCAFALLLEAAEQLRLPTGEQLRPQK
jgi:hypothetical protein